MAVVFVDTNVLYLILRPPPEGELRAWLQAQIARFCEPATRIIVSPLILDELAYRLLLASVADEGGARPLEILRADKVAVLERHGARIAQLLRDKVVALPGLTVAPVTEHELDRALDYLVTYRLLPRDALHLAVAEAKRCDLLLSTDPDFARAATLIPWEGPPVSVPKG